MKKLLFLFLLCVSSFFLQAQSSFVLENFTSSTNIWTTWAPNVLSTTFIDPSNSSNTVAKFNPSITEQYGLMKGEIQDVSGFNNALKSEKTILKFRMRMDNPKTLNQIIRVRIFAQPTSTPNDWGNHMYIDFTPTIYGEWADYSFDLSSQFNEALTYNYISFEPSINDAYNETVYIDDIQLTTPDPILEMKTAYSLSGGNKIIIHCNNPLVSTSDFSGFTITSDNIPQTISFIELYVSDSSMLLITLSAPVDENSALVATYSGGTIRDINGLSLQPFSKSIANLYNIHTIYGWRDDFDSDLDTTTNALGGTNPPFTTLSKNSSGDGYYSVVMNGANGWLPLYITTYGSLPTAPKEVMDLTGRENVKLRYRILSNSVSQTCYLRIELKDKLNDRLSDQTRFVPLQLTSDWTDISFDLRKTLENVYGPSVGLVDQGSIYQVAIYIIEKEGTAANSYVPTCFNGTIEFDYIEVGADFVQEPVFVKTINCTAGSLSSLLSANEKNTIEDLVITGSIDARDFKTMRDSMPNLTHLNISAVTIESYTGNDGTYSFPDNVYPANTIPIQAFYYSDTYTGKTSLLNIIFPETLLAIDRDALGSSGLLSVFIPASVETIAHTAFIDTKGLITVDDNNPNYSSLDGVLFNKTKDSLIVCPTTKLGTYTIPSTVKIIAFGAFLNCIYLDSIILPASILEIDGWAFAYCTGLTTVTIPSSLQRLGYSAFSGCINLQSIFANSITPIDLTNEGGVFVAVNTESCFLYVPEESIDLYKAAIQWEDFNNIHNNANIVDCPTIEFENLEYKICPSNSQIYLQDIPFTETFMPVNVFAIDTVFSEQYFNLGKNFVSVTVRYDNGCVVSKNDTLVVTQLVNPAPPISQNMVFEIGQQQGLEASCGENAICQWIDVPELFQYFQDESKSRSFLEMNNPIGEYQYSVIAIDTITYCWSDTTLVHVKIVQLNMASIKGTVNANGISFTDGSVQLFRKIGETYEPTAISAISDTGTFEFKYLEPAIYIFRAIPNTAFSTSSAIYLPTYYYSTTNWTEASEINVIGNIEGIDINLVEFIPAISGTGVISGTIVSSDVSLDYESLYKALDCFQVPVYVKQNDVIVGCGLTDINGNYTISNLPDGSYDVYVEFPGYTKQINAVTITDGSTEELNFTLKDGTITVNLDAISGISMFVYPNPTHSLVTISSDKTIESIEITDILGNVLQTIKGENKVDISNYKSGNYIFNITTSEGVISKNIIKE